MKALAFAVILTGIIAFWGFAVLRSDLTAREEARTEAVAANYAMFRNAVFNFALTTKTPGTILPDNPNLHLPQGWTSLRDWRGLVQTGADGLLYCYVYGPAQPAEAAAIQRLFNESLVTGWNNAGVLTRNGSPMPPAIPDRNIVSVIRLD
jgi:hypothetical protein